MSDKKFEHNRDLGLDFVPGQDMEFDNHTVEQAAIEHVPYEEQVAFAKGARWQWEQIQIKQSLNLDTPVEWTPTSPFEIPEILADYKKLNGAAIDLQIDRDDLWDNNWKNLNTINDLAALNEDLVRERDQLKEKLAKCVEMLNYVARSRTEFWVDEDGLPMNQMTMALIKVLKEIGEVLE